MQAHDPESTDFSGSHVDHGDSGAAELQLQAPWMRRLARSLLEDHAAADDVVQEAWRKLRGKAHPRSYLAAVVRSLASTRRRSESRRRLRERAAARSEALPSAAEVAERTELARRLAEAVEALNEPYRTTIVLHFWEDMPSAEIARRTGVPAATVRSHLSRGLERLRRRLDAGAGGRPNWTAALLPFARHAEPPHPVDPVKAPLAGHGSLSASPGAWLALGACLALAVGSLTFLKRVHPADLGTGLAASPAVAVGGSATTPQQPPPQEIRDSGPGRAPARSPGRPPRESTARAEDGPTAARITMRVASASGLELQGTWMRLRLAPEHSAHANGDERLTLELEAPELERLAGLREDRTLEVEAGARGHATERLYAHWPEGTRELNLGEAILFEGCSVRGRVVDSSGLGLEGVLVVVGRPMEGPSDASKEDDPNDGSKTDAPGWAWTPTTAGLLGPSDLKRDRWSGFESGLVGTSGPGGEYRLEGVPAGYRTVWARTDRGPWAHTAPVGLRVGEEAIVPDLVLPRAPGSFITGRVFDPEERPLGHLEVRFSQSDRPSGWHTVRTDLEGRFHFGPREGAPQNIGVRSPREEWGDLELPDVPAGTHDLELHFEPSPTFLIAARTKDGAPIVSGRAECLPADGSGAPLPRSARALDYDGHARLPMPAGEIPAGEIKVRVSAPGYRDLVLGPLVPEVEGGGSGPLLAVLEPVPALVGRVLKPDGTPAAGAKVSLHGAGNLARQPPPPGVQPLERYRQTHQGWVGTGTPFVYELVQEPVATTLTDEEGRYRMVRPGVDAAPLGNEPPSTRGGTLPPIFGGPVLASAGSEAPSDEPWYLHAALPGYATVTSGPHRWDPADGDDEQLTLQLPPPGALDGRLVLEGGGSSEGWSVYAADGLVEVVQAAVGDDGSFRFDNLHEGGWQLRAFEPASRYYGGNLASWDPIVPDVVIAAGSVAHHELHTAIRESATLQGSLTIDGVAPGPWSVSVRTVSKVSAISSYETTLDPDGLFLVRLQPGLTTHVSINGRIDGGSLTVKSELTLRSGPNAWSLDLSTARLEGRLHGSTSSPFAGQVIVDTAMTSTSVSTLLSLDENGAFGPMVVPAGHVRIVGRRTGREAPPVIAEFELLPGEHRRLDLP